MGPMWDFFIFQWDLFLCWPSYDLRSVKSHIFFFCPCFGLLLPRLVFKWVSKEGMRSAFFLFAALLNKDQLFVITGLHFSNALSLIPSPSPWGTPISSTAPHGRVSFIKKKKTRRRMCSMCRPRNYIFEWYTFLKKKIIGSLRCCWLVVEIFFVFSFCIQRNFHEEIKITLTYKGMMKSLLLSHLSL